MRHLKHFEREWEKKNAQIYFWFVILFATNTRGLLMSLANIQPSECISPNYRKDLGVVLWPNIYGPEAISIVLDHFRLWIFPTAEVSCEWYDLKAARAELRLEANVFPWDVFWTQVIPEMVVQNSLAWRFYSVIYYMYIFFYSLFLSFNYSCQRNF